jgi:hypothetical protein
MQVNELSIHNAPLNEIRLVRHGDFSTLELSFGDTRLVVFSNEREGMPQDEMRRFARALTKANLGAAIEISERE